MTLVTDYGRPERKWPSLHGRKLTPTPKSLGTAEENFVCHIGQVFPTQDKNQPKAGFCPSGFINFAHPKNLCTYQVVSNIT